MGETQQTQAAYSGCSECRATVWVLGSEWKKDPNSFKGVTKALRIATKRAMIAMMASDDKVIIELNECRA